MIKSFPRYIFDVAIVAAIFVAGLAYYGDIYKNNESKFSFYQKYFYSAVNIYCLKDPDLREYNSPTTLEVNERIDPSKVSCSDLGKSRKLEKSYYNGWHDTHPILSTLIGYNWRLLGFTWEALWPIAGSLPALAVLSFYLILRCFGLPWYGALLLFPITVPFDLLERNFYFLRDFSKVPFILLGFALIGILFKSDLTYRARALVLAGAAGIVAVGVGFRQDALVLIPAILAGAAFTSSADGKGGLLRFVGELGIIVVSFCLTGLAIDFLKTNQVAQLQGYPHFVLQGFADHFLSEARTEVPGVSFLALYSDTLAWAAVDANSPEKVGYFGFLDPQYTPSGINLIARYASLSSAEMITRIFSGLSVFSHGNWIIERLGIWLLLLLVLVGLGRWRLGFFLIFSMLSLAAAGSLQFSPRHSLHFIMLDRALLVIILAAMMGAVWRFATSGLDTRIGLALYSGFAGIVLLVAVVIGAHFFQQASVAKLKRELEALPWFAAEEAYKSRFPQNSEAILRFTVNGAGCSSGKLEAIMEVEGQKLSRPLDLLDGPPRYVYFAVFDPAIAKVSVDIMPEGCVAERAWGPLGDSSIPPLQFFDPDVAARKNSIRRHLASLIHSLL